MQSFPRRLLVIRPATNPSMPCRAPPRISTPACVGPTVGANCRGKSRQMSAESDLTDLCCEVVSRRESTRTRDSAIYPGFGPLCLELKTYSCFLLLRGPSLRLQESAYR